MLVYIKQYTFHTILTKQYLISNENFKFSNLNPFTQIYAKIIKVTKKLFQLSLKSLHRTIRCSLEPSSILNSKVFLQGLNLEDYCVLRTVYCVLCTTRNDNRPSTSFHFVSASQGQGYLRHGVPIHKTFRNNPKPNATPVDKCCQFRTSPSPGALLELQYFLHNQSLLTRVVQNYLTFSKSLLHLDLCSIW